MMFIFIENLSLIEAIHTHYTNAHAHQNMRYFHCQRNDTEKLFKCLFNENEIHLRRVRRICGRAESRVCERGEWETVNKKSAHREI